MIRLLTSPVWGGVPKGVYQDYGPTTVSGEPYSYVHKSLFHCGMDIGDLGIGWPLHAARGGLVVSVGWGQLGIQVGAETDWYIHIDSACVVLGQRVVRNQLVAYSGGKVPSGGVIYGAHLHFEVQEAPPPIYNRPLTSVDPEPMLVALYSGGGNELSTTSAPSRRATTMLATKDWIVLLRRGTDNALWYERWDSISAKWSGWKSLGGTLGSPDIAATVRGDTIDVFVLGHVDGSEVRPTFHIWSTDGGATWSIYEAHGGDGGPLVAVAGTPGREAEILAAIEKIPGGTATDRTGEVLAAIADLAAHPTVANDPALLKAVQDLSTHLGMGTP